MTLTDYASVSTIIASVVAVYTLCTWRKHQTYSMHLDVLVNLEEQYENLISGYISLFHIHSDVKALNQLSQSSLDRALDPTVNKKISGLKQKLSSSTQEVRIVECEKALFKALRLKLIKQHSIVDLKRIDGLFHESLGWLDEVDCSKRNVELKSIFKEEFTSLLRHGTNHIIASRKHS
ncbi:hypothetical protein C4G81_RS22290 [Vibrio parahaemolyticus]|uniref:hypothetical protein n=3 Tax=Vibrio parahaemolyticus TaxID=670 RepID=UPI00111EC837|nr:hypothetical protein [Vibrio parahaemolyticus]EJG0692353.1 hypothetical protein [Vibrio parahaemolyticus]